jgi:hypothetical protein
VSTTIKPNYGQPALIGGVVMGVLSALPLISAGNVCCCLWVITGGVVAAYVFQQNHPAPITPGDGALVGLLAGLVGALIQVVVSVPITLMVGPMERALLERVADMAGSMPPDMRDFIDRYSREGQSFTWVVVGTTVALMFWLFVGAVFSTIGGLLGAAVFRRADPPLGTIDVPPAGNL